LPITVWAWSEASNSTLSVVVTTCLDKSTVGKDGTRGAQEVGLDEEGSECVGNDIVFNRVSCAILFHYFFIWVNVASTVG